MGIFDKLKSIRGDIFGSTFGDDKKRTNIPLSDGFSPFNIGGVTGSKDGSNINIGPTDARSDLVSGLGNIFNRQAEENRAFLPQINSSFNSYAGAIDNDLLPEVKPGFGALSRAQADAFGIARERLRNTRAARTSNLKEDLTRRNIAGSSFAQDTQTRTEAEFDVLERELAAAEGEAAAKASMQELEATIQLIDRKYQASTNRINTSFEILNNAFAAEAQAKGVALDDMNNILQIGANILTNTQNQAAQNSRIEAEMAYKEVQAKAAKKSSLFGMLGGAAGFIATGGNPLGAMVGSSLGSSFG